MKKASGEYLDLVFIENEAVFCNDKFTPIELPSICITVAIAVFYILMYCKSAAVSV